MSKQFNVTKYGGIVREVLNDLKARKGNKISWTVFATDKKISNNLGVVLQRVGLVEKIQNGKYRSNIGVPYITKSQGEAVAKVIKEHDLIQHPDNPTAATKAKVAIEQMGIVRDESKLKKRGRKPLNQTAPITVQYTVTKENNPLRNFSSQALLFELGRRIKK